MNNFVYMQFRTKLIGVVRSQGSERPLWGRRGDPEGLEKGQKKPSLLNLSAGYLWEFTSRTQQATHL